MASADYSSGHELISVIVPVYNVAPYLPYCLDSLIGQTYRHLEIILVNDGSTDDSLSVCESYAARDPRISVISQPNQGLSGARNTGIGLATGSLISFIDSDDYIDLRFFERLYAALTDDVKISMGMARIVRDYTAAPCDPSPIAPPELIGPQEYYRRIFNDVKYVSAWGKLYRAELFKTIRFPVGKLHEDIFIMYDIAEQAGRIAVTPLPLYQYVKRENSITTSGFKPKKLELLQANQVLTSKAVTAYPSLEAAAQAYAIHARTSLIRQMDRQAMAENKSMLRETICMARSHIGSILRDPGISKGNKLLCAVSCTTPSLIRLAWKAFSLIR